jgi:nitric oxide reductase activation protein
MTSSGIEPATFRFVAQHLNHCATAVPDSDRRKSKYWDRNLSQCHLPTKNSHGLTRGSSHVLRGERPATDRLSRGTALRLQSTLPIHKHCCYLTENTVRFHYKERPVSAADICYILLYICYILFVIITQNTKCTILAK